MLVDAICWAFAMVVMFTNTFDDLNNLQKLWLMIGFIFVGTLSRFVSTYRDVHSKKSDEKSNT